MEFRKMVMITLHARQKKRHRCIDLHFLDELDRLDVTGRICLLWGHWPCAFCWSVWGQARRICSYILPFSRPLHIHFPIPPPTPDWHCLLAQLTHPRLRLPCCLQTACGPTTERGCSTPAQCIPSLGPQHHHPPLCQRWNSSSPWLCFLTPVALTPPTLHVHKTPQDLALMPCACHLFFWTSALNSPSHSHSGRGISSPSRC